MGGHHEEHSSGVFNIAIATIFAREFLEGAIIIGQYRTVINKSDWDAERKQQGLKTVTMSAAGAIAVAIAVVLAVAIPLGILGRDLNDKTVELIEGISKLVASICIVQLSLKIPGWLGIYWKVSIFPWKNKVDGAKKLDEFDLSVREIQFNVAWNIWREVAECGVFLIPFFLGSDAKQIPVSAIVGAVISLIIGLGIYIANDRMKDKSWLAVFMSGLTLMLAVGLFVGACHEFEEVYGETKAVWSLGADFWDHGKFPMVILKPFGYSSNRTVLQITSFWLFLALGLSLHFLKWSATQTAKANHTPADDNVTNDDAELGNSTTVHTDKKLDEGSAEEEESA
jgi:high-affinity iron transporter